MAKRKVQIEVDADYDTLIELLSSDLLDPSQADVFIQAIQPLTFDQLEELLAYEAVSGERLAELLQHMTLDLDQIEEILAYDVLDEDQQRGLLASFTGGKAPDDVWSSVEQLGTLLRESSLDPSVITPELAQSLADSDGVSLAVIACLMEQGVQDQQALSPLLVQALNDRLVDLEGFLAMLREGFDDVSAIGAIIWLLLEEGELTGESLVQIVEAALLYLDEDMLMPICDRLAEKGELTPEVIQRLNDNGYLTDIVDEVREERDEERAYQREMAELKRRTRRNRTEDDVIADDDYLTWAANSGNMPGFLKGGLLDDAYGL